VLAISRGAPAPDKVSYVSQFEVNVSLDDQPE
jgi:hypothetical protein